MVVHLFAEGRGIMARIAWESWLRSWRICASFVPEVVRPFGTSLLGWIRAGLPKESLGATTVAVGCAFGTRGRLGDRER